MGLHGCTFSILTSLISQMSGATKPIEVMVDTSLKKEIEENRKKLVPLLILLFFVVI